MAPAVHEAPWYQQAEVCYFSSRFRSQHLLFFYSPPFQVVATAKRESWPHIYIKHLCQSFDCVCAREGEAISFD